MKLYAFFVYMIFIFYIVYGLSVHFVLRQYYFIETLNSYIASVFPANHSRSSESSSGARR